VHTLVAQGQASPPPPQPTTPALLSERMDYSTGFILSCSPLSEPHANWWPPPLPDQRHECTTRMYVLFRDREGVLYVVGRGGADERLRQLLCWVGPMCRRLCPSTTAAWHAAGAEACSVVERKVVSNFHLPHSTLPSLKRRVSGGPCAMSTTHRSVQNNRARTRGRLGLYSIFFLRSKTSSILEKDCRHRLVCGVVVARQFVHHVVPRTLVSFWGFYPPPPPPPPSSHFSSHTTQQPRTGCR
jgi:hypothetical protein